MTNFWRKLQISSVLLSQNKQPKKLLQPIVERLDIISSHNRLSFWSRLCGCKVDESQSRADRAAVGSGKRLPERPKLCNPECTSKCLQIKNCDTDMDIVREKLTNCQAPEKKIEKPKSYWEIIFGCKKAEVLDPTIICRRAHLERQMARERDPRLCDSRYKITPGDVFVFTEAPKPQVRVSREPQPQQPPSYKLPKAVLTNKITEQAKKIPHNCAAVLQFDASCGSPKCSIAKKPSVLFEEMRPPEKQRKVFSCKHGIRSEDVTAPIRRDSNNCRTSKTSNSFNPTDYQQQRSQSANDWKPPESTSELELSIHGTRKFSRIEQLKRQTTAKHGSSAIIRRSQCQQKT